MAWAVPQALKMKRMIKALKDYRGDKDTNKINTMIRSTSYSKISSLDSTPKKNFNTRAIEILTAIRYSQVTKEETSYKIYLKLKSITKDITMKINLRKIARKLS